MGKRVQDGTMTIQIGADRLGLRIMPTRVLDLTNQRVNIMVERSLDLEDQNRTKEHHLPQSREQSNSF